MALLDGFNLSLSEMVTMGEASAASFVGGSIPSGWSVVTPQALGVPQTYWDGNYFTDPNSGASAIVLRQGGTFIVSFRGTDGANDVNLYQELFFGTYINHYQPLLSALAANAPGDAGFYFTGASLGGGATNLMAGIAASQYGGRFAAAKFVAFASPNITNANGILNVGFENDPVYKAIAPSPFAGYGDFASSLDNLVMATPEYMAGNYDGRNPFDAYAHNIGAIAGDVPGLLNSVFQNFMSPDAVLIFDAVANGLVQDVTPGRENVGVFYLGQSRDDQIAGRNGNDFIEGFAGNDTLAGGAGSDMIAGGIGQDTAVFTGRGADHLVYTRVVSQTMTTSVVDVVGSGGNDTLYGVETLGFADRSVPFVSAQQNWTSNIDGGRFDDVVYRSVSNGQVIFKDMAAGVAGAFDAVTNPLNTAFRAIGTGDVTGDGKADVFIWNSATGQVLTASPGTSGAPVWGVLANGINGPYAALDVTDVNGDGFADVLVRHNPSGTIFWQNSAAPAQWGIVGINLGASWTYQGAGDVNRDGFSDVAISHTSGKLLIANMANGVNSGYFDLGNISGLSVREVADVNADGFADVIVQNEANGQTLWRNLSGSGAQWNVATHPLGPSWVVAGTADVDNDGRAEGLFQHALSGETIFKGFTDTPVAGWGGVSTPLGGEWLVV